jgi:chromosome segregation ATPase
MSSAHKVSAGQRRQMIAEAAYFRAERRGFDAGDPIKDWMEAEAEVDARLKASDEEDHWLERLEEGLATANKRLTSYKRKLKSLSADARVEWQKDVDKLGKLRDKLRPQVKALRDQGSQAGHAARQQAEKAWNEISELMHRVGKRAGR